MCTFLYAVGVAEAGEISCTWHSHAHHSTAIWKSPRHIHVQRILQPHFIWVLTVISKRSRNTPKDKIYEYLCVDIFSEHTKMLICLLTLCRFRRQRTSFKKRFTIVAKPVTYEGLLKNCQYKHNYTSKQSHIQCLAGMVCVVNKIEQNSNLRNGNQCVCERPKHQITYRNAQQQGNGHPANI